MGAQLSASNALANRLTRSVCRQSAVFCALYVRKDYAGRGWANPLPVRKTERSAANTVILTVNEGPLVPEAGSILLEHAGEALAIVGMDGDETESDVVGCRRARWEQVHPGHTDLADHSGAIGQEDLDLELRSFLGLFRCRRASRPGPSRISCVHFERGTSPVS